jgi:hypothetical protein
VLLVRERAAEVQELRQPEREEVEGAAEEPEPQAVQQVLEQQPARCHHR